MKLFAQSAALMVLYEASGDQMKHSRRLTFSTLLLLALSALVSPSANCTTLIGEVEHSERLEPIENSLSPGQILDMRNVQQTAGDGKNNWYLVPNWLAGTWHKEQQTDYFRYWYKTGQEDIETHNVPARSDGTWGTQRDEKGNIWQYDPAPFTTSVDSGSDIIIQVVRLSEPVECTAKRFVRRSVDTQIRVDKLSNVIKSVESGEQISSYTPEVANLVKRTTSAKVFDQQGQPVLLGKSFSYERKTAEFAPQDIYAGKDMRSLFQQFLQRQAVKPAEPSNSSNSSGKSGRS
jgi:hypothetical protein